ncbi:hypothetical protein L0B53_03570 [Vibrio sp. SS-MA-C1-2]|uniref:GntR family transcriptional regulator YhfZ n=1 Tax=Vibrio sp. SS-MA-C1-2 TaxID=2908646 RepID=UPI001F2A40B4|nr:GntR family transcriptional regulator YhfZ [Vibrio sp. SS-MA-C1-2]UJF17030.1 hypothetical protein L0B53_03570 [Vibrio sp. SS-MA-C1-2]
MKYLKKYRSTIINLARYLMAMKVGERLKTIDELSNQLECSVGYVAESLKYIEKDGAVSLKRQGRNGTVISAIDMTKLIELCDIGNIVCAMPLPYTKHYEGLASGLKAQINSIPLYFAHMRGANIRAECLINGVHDMAIMSKMASEQYVKAGELEIILELGPHSYVPEHRIIYRKGEHDNIKVMGVDSESPDQFLLTEIYKKDKKVTVKETSYNECLERIANGNIDAAIWYASRQSSLEAMGLEERSVEYSERFIDASIAVVVAPKQATHLKTMIQSCIDSDQLLSHQERVIKRLIMPTY